MPECGAVAVSCVCAGPDEAELRKDLTGLILAVFTWIAIVGYVLARGFDGRRVVFLRPAQ